MDFVTKIIKNNTTDRETSYNELPNHITLLYLVTLTSFAGILIKVLFNKFKSWGLSSETFVQTNSEVSFIPTLPSIPVVGPLYPLLRKDFGKLFTFWISKYGTTFQAKILGRNVVVLNEPKWLQKLLTSTEPGHLLKYSTIYHTLFPGVMKTGLIATTNIPDWKHNRSILSKAFSLESLKAYITVFNRDAKKLIADMHAEISDNAIKEVRNGKTMHEMLRESTFNSFAEIIIGGSAVSAEDKLRVNDKFARCQDIISYRYYHPWCLIDFVWKFYPQRKEMDELIDSLTQMFAKVVRDGRKKQDEEKTVKSFIDYMDAAGLDVTQIFAEVTNSFSAGYDTVGIALNYFLFNMALHPKYQDECRKEIDEVFYSLSGSCDEVDGDVTFDALSEMKYLEMCIKESLRIFTPIPVFLRELGTPLNLDEKVVLGKGTLVFITPSLIHRDPKIFPDPVTYDPDRFLPENCKGRSAYSYLPFSFGVRNCIGGKLAMVQIKLVASYILRHYEVYTENSYENLSQVWNKSIWPTKDLGVCWKKRRNIV